MAQTFTIEQYEILQKWAPVVHEAGFDKRTDLGTCFLLAKKIKNYIAKNPPAAPVPCVKAAPLGQDCLAALQVMTPAEKRAMREAISFGGKN